MRTYESVFIAHPDADVLYVVGGMPFLDAGAATAHAKDTGMPVEKVTKPESKPEQSAEAEGENTPESKPEPEPKTKRSRRAK